MHEIVTVGIYAFAATTLYSSLWAIAALIYQRIDYADIAWGGGFIAAAAAAWWHTGAHCPLSILMLTLVTVWGVRLSWHIGKRIQHSTHEDPRYKSVRQFWGHWQSIGILIHFLLQSALTLIIIAPVLVIMAHHEVTVSSWLVVSGLMLWLFGFIYELIADHQLATFLHDPSNRGHILRTGLWHYSRHPNYFGEIVQWWAFWLIALAVPYGWITVIGPITITYMIVFVSGIPPLEKNLTSIPGYANYKKNTKILIPWIL